jgi:hypothetical protein
MEVFEFHLGYFCLALLEILEQISRWLLGPEGAETVEVDGRFAYCN